MQAKLYLQANYELIHLSPNIFNLNHITHPPLQNNLFEKATVSSSKYLY